MRDNAILRMLRGHRAAAARQRDLLQTEGPNRAQAVREAISATVALARGGAWPAARDPVNERAVEQVRRRWARIGRNAKLARRA